MQTQEHSDAGDFRMIPLANIIPSPTNPRRQFDAESIKSLAESIRQHGVLQPILVRQTGATGGKDTVFEIVAGERRFRAAKLAERSEIPARVETLSDAEALQVQIIENLQREDVHPLDEAQGFKHLQEAARLELSDIAQRVACDVRYVTRRLALTNLIEEAQTDFRKELITLAHALEICRLSPEIQEAALATCYERTSVWNQKEQTYNYVPDKERPARHVRHLQEWLMHNVHLNLHKAPFKLDDTRLRADGLACVSCPQRTGNNRGLFDDIKNGDTCLSPLCFKGKVQTLVNIRKTELDAKRERAAPFISPYYDTRIEGQEVLTRPQYQLIEKKVDRCQHAEQAVYADGEGIGQVKWICREPTCKDHLGRVRDTYAGATVSTSGLSATSPENRNKRKQELFDIRVDEIVRKRVMAESLKTYKFPFERAHLNEVACEFFRRIPSDDQRTILEVFGWNEKEAATLRMNDDKVLAELAKLDNRQLAQFMMLCSFAHFGANQYKNHQVSQQQVAKLSKERNVNHTLIDAQVRLELAPKKYRAKHQAYLDAVANGKAAKKPTVFEQPQPEASASDETERATATPSPDASKPGKTATKRGVKRAAQNPTNQAARRKQKVTSIKTTTKAKAAARKAA